MRHTECSVGAAWTAVGDLANQVMETNKKRLDLFVVAELQAKESR